MPKAKAKPASTPEKKRYKILAGNGCHRAIAEVQGMRSLKIQSKYFPTLSAEVDDDDEIDIDEIEKQVVL